MVGDGVGVVGVRPPPAHPFEGRWSCGVWVGPQVADGGRSYRPGRSPRLSDGGQALCGRRALRCTQGKLTLLMAGG